MNTEKIKENAMEEFLEDNLPHGSGIDYKWEIEFLKNGSIKCTNGWHFMSEYGFYMFGAPFSITFKKDDFFIQFHNISSNERRHLNNHMIKDYLYDLFHNFIVDNGTEFINYFKGAN